MRILNCKLLFVLAVLFLALSGSAMAYTYVGSWQVDQGPDWSSGTTNVFSGQQTAAFLFGGNPVDYSISTKDNNPANINHLAWYTAFGIGNPNIAPILPNGQDNFPAGSQLPEGTVIDWNNNGVYDYSFDSSGNFQFDYSSYLRDWAQGSIYTNYAFTNAPVPEPGTVVLLGVGMAGLAFYGKRRKNNKA